MKPSSSSMTLMETRLRNFTYDQITEQMTKNPMYEVREETTEKLEEQLEDGMWRHIWAEFNEQLEENDV